MKRVIRFKHATLAVVAAAVMAPSVGFAESGLDTGAGASVDARLDFRVIIPTFLVFQVGTAGGTVDEICFQPTATEVQTGATVGADPSCSTSGDGDGTLAVSVLSNGGQVTITEDNDGGGNGLVSGGGDFLDYSTISTSSDNFDLDAPTLSNSSLNTSSPALSSGSVTSATANWTYQFTSPGFPPAAGTYTGRVTYTAAVP